MRLTNAQKDMMTYMLIHKRIYKMTSVCFKFPHTKTLNSLVKKGLVEPIINGSGETYGWMLKGDNSE